MHVTRVRTSQGITAHRDGDVRNLRVKPATVWSDNEVPEASWGLRWKTDSSLIIKNHHRVGTSRVLPPTQQRQSVVLCFHTAHVLSCFGWETGAGLACSPDCLSVCLRQLFLLTVHLNFKKAPWAPGRLQALMRPPPGSPGSLGSNEGVCCSSLRVP